jgi:hypothetical protein
MILAESATVIDPSWRFQDVPFVLRVSIPTSFPYGQGESRGWLDHRVLAGPRLASLTKPLMA